MKTHSLAIPALLLFCALPTGCKSTEGHDHAENTADKVVAVGAAAGQTQLQLDKTLEALAQVEANRSKDPKPAYGTFAKSFDAFSGELAGLVGDRAALKSSADAWFSEYTRQNSAIQDEDLRRTGEKRLAEFKGLVAEASEQVDKLLQSASAIEGRLTDLHTYLSNDLTPDGIEAVSGRIDDVTSDGRKLAARLGELSKSAQELAGKMRAARPPPPAPAAK
jgi:phage-related minor tail protein